MVVFFSQTAAATYAVFPVKSWPPASTHRSKFTGSNAAETSFTRPVILQLTKLMQENSYKIATKT
jgi:hypothetical protein